MAVRPGPARVLVVEDDPKTAEIVALYLRREGHLVHVEHRGDRALDRLREQPFDLVIADVMLPGTDGLDLCRQVRARGTVPVILLTARTREEERVAGLDLGADDYVTKPFSPRELVARVRALLRRAPPGGEDFVVVGDLVIDRARRGVRVGDRDVELTTSEFALLEALASHPGHVRSRAQLLAVLPGGASETLDRTVDVHIRNLRRKIEPVPSRPAYIRTVVGAGYRLLAPETVG
ncbi:MAG: response regulator transcription factor [Gemmatimonadota bacterium]